MADDTVLQNWIAASSDPTKGNIAGLPKRVTTRCDLEKILTSIVYRVTAHGASRLNTTANPWMSFVANLPPCLQSSKLPALEEPLSLSDLCAYLPNTVTIGEMLGFLYTFVFSAPYVPFIPPAGFDKCLFFGNDPETPLNVALIEYRHQIADFVCSYVPDSPLIHQFPLCIET